MSEDNQKTARIRFAPGKVEALLDDGLITVEHDEVVKEDAIPNRPGATVIAIPMGPQMYSAWVANLHSHLGGRAISSPTLVAQCLRRCGFFERALTSPMTLITPGDLRLILSAQPVYRCAFSEEKAA